MSNAFDEVAHMVEEFELDDAPSAPSNDGTEGVIKVINEQNKVIDLLAKNIVGIKRNYVTQDELLQVKREAAEGDFNIWDQLCRQSASGEICDQIQIMMHEKVKCIGDYNSPECLKYYE
ncbi:MAG: hypothetical protein N4A31_02580 [Rickettsiales bacterium]|jgi:hypothetical protein|nr:hypothetical protein [Rickettsiales bacterium]